ncbi:hypothetical protein BH10CYA1_BH10CYA1_39450 [soil metagenome]
MSVSPFHSVMTSRAAFDAGQRSDDGVVNGLNLTDIAGQPPLSQGREGVALKIKAPPLTPLTLDLGGNTYGSSSEVNYAGVLRTPKSAAFSAPESLTVGNQVALKAPETVALRADHGIKNPDGQVAENNLPKRSGPALSLPNFEAVNKATDGKYANASYDLSMQPDGGIRHKYTATDFSTLTLTSKDGAAIAVATDPYARPTIQEELRADGSSRVTRFAYNDDGSRKAMFASSKEVTNPDGTVKTFNYDKFGKVLQA